MTEAVIEVEGLHAGYGGDPVVRDLTLHVMPQEIVALLGPNGAGKTTTLLTISGLLPAIAGEVRLFGRRVDTRRPARQARRGLAHVPEDRSLFFQLTARENMLLGKYRGKADIAQALEYFPALEPLLDTRAGLLSGGEQQMLALARALVGEPKVLMVDEMSLGLAPIIVERLLPVLRRIVKERGVAVILVEQHVQLALEFADRAYVLAHGSLSLEGAASDLLQRPDLLEVSYLGESAL